VSFHSLGTVTWLLLGLESVRGCVHVRQPPPSDYIRRFPDNFRFSSPPKDHSRGESFRVTIERQNALKRNT